MRVGRGIWKAAVAICSYFAGFVYLGTNLNLGDRAFQSMIRKDDAYTQKIKLDPLFQNFYIINIMRYFGISDRLMKKTEEELKARIRENEGKTVKQGSAVVFEKEVISLV